MNQNNHNVSFEVVEELFRSLDQLLRSRKSSDQHSRVVKEQTQPAARPDLSKQSPAPLKPRLERAPR
jgi:hypothetical protein